MEKQFPEAIKSVEKPGPVVKAEQNVYSNVYHVLVIGMSISTALFVIGIILALLNPHYIPLTTVWIREHYHWAVIFSGLRNLNPAIVMMLATILLILTPVARVFVSILAFNADHDSKYVVVTSTVFLVIVLTVVLGWLGLK